MLNWNHFGSLEISIHRNFTWYYNQNSTVTLDEKGAWKLAPLLHVQWYRISDWGPNPTKWAYHERQNTLCFSLCCECFAILGHSISVLGTIGPTSATPPSLWATPISAKVADSTKRLMLFFHLRYLNWGTVFPGKNRLWSIFGKQ